MAFGPGDLLDVAQLRIPLSVYWVRRRLEELVEGVVAEFPAEHVEDHGSFFEGFGLELGGVGVEAAEGGEGLGVVGKGSGGDVADGGLEGQFLPAESSTYMSSA